VARLKGGDPYVFGRGAEEAEELLDAGVDFEIVPGVTSAVAAPAYAGIPLTHRRYASSVSFITGHEDPGKEKSVHNWEALAAGTSTLVFFMGVKNLEWICSSLIRAGMDQTTPAALVRWGTTCEQASLAGTVSTIVDQARQRDFRPPALLVVGQVVRLRDRLNWFEKRPLLGRGVVVTRAREQASDLVHLLQDRGACCYPFPTIAIQPLPDTTHIQEALHDLHHLDWLVFTSVNGVRFFWEQLRLAGLDSRAIGPCRVATIGPATADAVRSRGINPDFVPETYVAESVVQGMLSFGVQGKEVLIPRAETAREILPQELKKAGARVRVLPVYRTELAEESPDPVLEAMDQGKVHVVTFTSSSTVSNFFSLLTPDQLRPHVQSGQVRLACIGPITARTLESYGFEAHIMPESYTVPALAQALEEAAVKSS
jgi:uroporphyrinogen III methyltransferase/synthase